MILCELTDWKLSGAWPYTPIQGNSMETGIAFSGVTDLIDAKVPGSVYDDLLRAGYIEDPYYEMNSLKCEWVAQRWWIYRTAFRLDESMRGRRFALVFRGIDYKARIYVNNRLYAEHENMYTPVKIDFTDTARFGSEENLVQVILESAPDEMGQIGYTSRTFTQKARFPYKWDFGTRLISLGLWDRVTVEADFGCAAVSKHIRWDSETSSVTFDAELDAAGEVTASLTYNGEPVSRASAVSENGIVSLRLPVDEPKLWYPNGYGPQSLYDLTYCVKNERGICDERTVKVGLRTLSYVRADGAVDSALPYCPVINGRRVYLKGVNMVPLDHFMGSVDGKRYEKFLTQAKDANINLIRVWGGGIIEKEEFYELCDRLGIMIWQEFIQSSSGIDNIPSEKPEFLEKLAETAEYAVSDRRNHVSLTFWSGGNELMEADGTPVNFGNRNIALLKSIVNRLDPDRVMLPTSASGPTEWRDDAHPENNQDIHGPWKYEGTEGHYNLYNTSVIQLHSEFGCDGMANRATLDRILAPENRIVTTVSANRTWRHHGEWWDTYAYRDRPLFGEISDLDLFCSLSQFMQAEGIRYALEANRRRAFQNVGSIVWQFNEPWPNVSCTSMVDYYGEPKLAYFFYRDAMKPLHVSLRYGKLTWKSGETFSGTLYVHDDHGTGWNNVSVEVKDESGTVLFEQSADRPFGFEFTVPCGIRSFTAECTLTGGGSTDVNRYLYFVLTDEFPKADTDAVLKYLEEYQR